MNPHQSVEPTPHPVHVRRMAFELAHMNQATPRSAKDVIEEAKKIETYLWGSFAPIEAAATPLSTILEAANATRDRLKELIENCASDLQKTKLFDALSQWERFNADLTAALSYSPKPAPEQLGGEPA